MDANFTLSAIQKVLQDPALLLQIDRIRVDYSEFRILKIREQHDGKLPLKTILPDGKDTDDMIENTFTHNALSVSPAIAWMRPMGLMGPLLGMDQIMNNIGTTRILIVGPRTEYEILWYLSRGFSEDNIVGLDLFSYSDKIQIGDMHCMPFDQDSFDVVVFSWVLGYSKSQQKAVDEAVRVLKTGGLIGIGEQWDPTPVEVTSRLMEESKGYKLEGTVTTSSSDLERLFEQYKHKVVFSTEPLEREKHRVGLISLITQVHK